MGCEWQDEAPVAATLVHLIRNYDTAVTGSASTHRAARPDLHIGRQLLQATRRGELAAGGEGAVVRLFGQRGRRAGDGFEALSPLRTVNGRGEQALGIGVH